MTTSASLDSASVQLQAGEQVVIPLQIRNNGEIVEGYNIEVVGPTAAWSTVEPSTVSLYPGSSTTATVKFHPPRSSGVPAGELQFGVVVTPTEHPDEAVVPEGVIEVLPFVETTAELLPHTSQGRRQGRHQIAVDNRGNVPVTALLTATDPTGKLRFALTPQALSVNPGEAVFAAVRARPVKRIWKGAPLTHPFAVEVAPQESPSVVLEGSYVQQPVFPPWILKALLALIALLLLLAAIWFLLLKPTIESTAEDAVSPQVEEAAKQADAAKEDAAAAEGAAGEAKEAAGTAGGGGEPGGEKSPGTGDPKTKAVKTTTAPFSSRLQVAPPQGASRTGTFTVPAKSTLNLRDFVMSNPQGDFGRLRVRLNSDVIFDMALENFRDIDYHFVVPVVAKAGDELTLTSRCNRKGAPPSGGTPATCDQGMLFGGELVKKTG